MPMPKGRPICSVPGCPRENVARGVCGTHYARLMKGQDLSVPIKSLRKYELDAVCSVDQCDQPVKSREWCANHYKRWWVRQGDPSDDRRPPCSVCIHPLRALLEARLSSGLTYSAAAEGTGLSHKRIEHHLTHVDVPRPDWETRRGLSRCPVCAHPEVDVIEELWARRPNRQRVHGDLSAPSLAARFGVSTDSILRHNSVKHQQRRALYELGRLNALNETG